MQLAKTARNENDAEPLHAPDAVKSCHMSIPPSRDLVVFAITIDADDDGSALLERFITERRVHTDPLSPVMGRMQGWLETCDREHAECQAAVTAQVLPTRVLDISPDLQSVRLVDTSPDERGRYVALSHCWGPAHDCITTEANLQQRKVQIKVSDMPQTFRDAVYMTAQLGVQYLWIDSFCIIQDSIEDWQAESGRMGDVYRNAYLALAATRAPGDVDGFLSERRLPEYYPIDLQYVTDGSRPLSLRIYAVHSHGKPEASATHTEPLMKRAWTLQERLLPMRTLSFGKQQNFFECYRGKIFENGDCDPWVLGTYDLESVYPRFHDGIQAVDFNPWYRWVEEFTARKLTYLPDRLPALSGLASRASEYMSVSRGGGHPPAYHAGLWGDDLLNGLLWSGFYRPRSRPAEYHAPSWSWASSNTDTAFPMTYEDRRHRLSDRPGGGTVGVPRHFGDRAHPVPQLQFRDVSTTLVGSDPFGQVSDGYIDLTAPLLEIRINEEEANTMHKWEYVAGEFAVVNACNDLAAQGQVTSEPDAPLPVKTQKPSPDTHKISGPWWKRCEPHDTIFALLLARKPEYGGLLVEKVDVEAETAGLEGHQQRSSLTTMGDDMLVVRRVGVFTIPDYLNRDLFMKHQEVLDELGVAKVRVV